MLNYSKLILQINLGLQAIDYLSTIYVVNYLALATEKNPLLQNNTNLIIAKLAICAIFYGYYRIDSEKKSYKVVMSAIAILYILALISGLVSVGFHLTQ